MIFWEEKPKTVQSQGSDVLCVHCDGSESHGTIWLTGLIEVVNF